MFEVRRMCLDTLNEHVVVIHQGAVAEGALGFQPLDRVRVIGSDPETGAEREITGVLNFCRDSLLERHQIGLSEDAFHDLGLAEGSSVRATLARSPDSVDAVRRKLGGDRLTRADFDAILEDVAARRYSKIELAMFVLACALRRLDTEEMVDLTRAMIECGSKLDFGPGPVADKHCIGGIPGNRTTMVVVPIVASLGVLMPKTSSRAITSPSGTADTMGVVADVALEPNRLRAVVEKVGACISWGGALDLAPADDVLITAERPMGIDTEAQMIASILAKKKTAGATHTLIDLPVGPTAKVRSHAQAVQLAATFERVAEAIELQVQVVLTSARGPIGRGVGPRLEALDVLDVLHGRPGAPRDLREKSLDLAARILEQVGAVPGSAGYRAAQQALDSGAAARKFEEIVAAQGARELPAEALHRCVISSPRDGHLRGIDCWEINQVAKLAGAPANPAAGLRFLTEVGAVVMKGEPCFEIHAQSAAQLEFAREYAASRPELFDFGY